MNKKLFYYTLCGIFLTAAAGTLLHFAYAFSRQNPLVGLFVPVNESTWEHMKLVFFPTFTYVLLGWPFFFRSRPLFFGAFLTGLLTGTFAVPVIFYTYTGILGFHCLFLDILTFLAGVLLVFCLGFQLVVQESRLLPVPFLVFLTVTLLVCFFLFTNMPPDVALFHDFPVGKS